jgi:type II secretory pathway pseudopilin PulG
MTHLPLKVKNRMAAFSLVELSIVLVILGLLTGGILTGQSLIKAAELRAITTELQQFQTAIHTFKGKYFALPGDMTNATLFWGKLAAHCNAEAGTAQADGTCNGNGDGVHTYPAGSNQDGEIFLFWQHLAKAGLIEGVYSGLSGPNGGDADNHILGVNAPASKFPNAGWGLDDGTLGGANDYDIEYVNRIEFGSPETNSDTDQPALTPEQTWNIDKKIDDGKPAYGKVIARYWDDECAAANDGTHSDSDLNASYKLSDATIQCAITFNKAF